MRMSHRIGLAFGQRCLVNCGLMCLGCVAFLEAHLLNIIQPLVRINKDARVVRFLLLTLLWRLETFTKMAMLAELVKKMQVATFLIMIIKNGVLAFDIRGRRLLGGRHAVVAAVEIHQRQLRLRLL